MSPDQKRAAVRDAYPGGNWLDRVEKMSNAQVAVIYNRILSKTPNKLNRSKK